MLSRLYAEGVVWVPGGNPAKKKRNFLGIFSLFSAFFFQKKPPPPAFVSKEVFIKWYIYMPNICGTSPAVWGDFFPGGGAPNRCLQQAWKIFPTAAAHPGNILMPWNDPRRQGEARGM